MSSITGAAYQVLTAAEQAARLSRAASARFAAATVELQETRRASAGFRAVYGRQISLGPEEPRLAPDATPAEIDAATEKVRAAAREHRELVQTQVAAATERKVRALSRPTPRPTGADASDRHAAAAARATAAAVEHAAEATRERHAEILAEAHRQLARLPADASPELREWCERSVVDIGAADIGRARLLLSGLTEQVSAEAGRAERVTRTATALAELAARLATVPTGAAQALRMEVIQVSDTRPAEIPADLTERAERLIADHDRDRQRRVVANAVAVALSEMEYDVGENFDTALASHGVGYASYPNAADYGVKLFLDMGTNVLRTQVVRRASVQADKNADRAAAQSFCDSYPDLLSHLARHRVATQPIGRVQPGAAVVRAVDDAMLPSIRRGDGRKQEREL
jgi:hypothetical protein